MILACKACFNVHYLTFQDGHIIRIGLLQHHRCGDHVSSSTESADHYQPESHLPRTLHSRLPALDQVGALRVKQCQQSGLPEELGGFLEWDEETPPEIRHRHGLIA